MAENGYCHEQFLVRGNYCSVCMQIPWGKLVRKKDSTILLHSNIRNLQDSEDCPLCSSLWSSVPKDLDLENRWVSVHCSFYKDWSSSKICWVVFLSHSPAVDDESVDDTEYIQSSRNQPMQTRWEARYSLLVKDDNELSSEILFRGVPCNPLSDLSVSTMRGWLATCNQHHSVCNISLSSSTSLPSRLIRVSSPGNPHAHLIDTREYETYLVYAALSHCWGTETQFTTTINTLQARTDGILIEELPKTFQDAINVCQKLDISYLWIDSICIVQDSLEDWEIESAKMASVYMNSHVTIAASRASSDAEGFLQTRKSSFEDEDVYEQEHQRVYEPSPGIYLHAQTTERNVLSEIASTPLSKRAWVYQERYLSSRALFFTSRETLWVCQQQIAAETGYLSSHKKTNIKGVSADLLASEEWNSKVVPGISVGGKTQGKLGRHRTWHNMIDFYTGCAITKPSDRLPALSGLVSFLASQTGEKYYAGIWGDSIIEGLLWKCNVENGIIQDVEAPSWSWTSMEGQIRFASCSSAEPLAGVINITVSSSSKLNLFSRVSWGTLTLFAPLLPASKLDRNNSPKLSPGTDFKSDIFLIGLPAVSYTAYGSYDNYANEDTGVFVCLLAYYPYCCGYFFGLLLKRTEIGQYRRVGTVQSFLYDDPSCETLVTDLVGDEALYPNLWDGKKAHEFVATLPREELTIV